MVDMQKPDPTGVYRILKTMEERGLVSSQWDGLGGRLPKKVHAITPMGIECLATWIRTLKGYRDSIEAFLDMAEGAFLHPQPLTGEEQAQ